MARNDNGLWVVKGKFMGKKTHKADGVYDSHAFNMYELSFWKEKWLWWKKSIDPHVFYKNYPVLLFDTYGSQDEMGD